MTLKTEDKSQNNLREALLTSTDHPNNFLGVIIRLDELLDSCV